MKKTVRLTETKVKRMIYETVKKILKENSADYVENSPNHVEYDGETYDFASGDENITLLFHNGEWLSGRGMTHRNLISYYKYGCNEDDLFEYYSYEKANTIHNIIDMLWSKETDFKYMSRLFYAKGKTKERGIKYILTSWSKLNELLIKSICNQFKINRNKILYIENN